jgi:hypothetical protein
VGLFDYWVSLDLPQETLTFSHVPSRYFNGSGIVNFADFASLAARWRQPADPATGAACDLNTDTVIGPADLAMFSDYWLERTDCSAPAAESATSTDAI